MQWWLPRTLAAVQAAESHGNDWDLRLNLIDLAIEEEAKITPFQRNLKNLNYFTAVYVKSRSRVALGIRFSLVNFFLLLIYEKIGGFDIETTINHTNTLIFQIIFQCKNMLLYFSVWSCDRLTNKGSGNLWLKVCYSLYYQKTIMVHTLLESYDQSSRISQKYHENLIQGDIHSQQN